MTYRGVVFEAVLADGEQPFDRVLDPLVRVAFLQDAAEALENRKQPCEGGNDVAGRDMCQHRQRGHGVPGE